MGSCTANYSDQFGTDVLTAIGAPVTAENLKFLRAWNVAESGSSAQQAKGTACYNPFNTTYKIAGDSNFTFAPAIRSYASYQDGVAGTSKTLMQSNMAVLRAALVSGTSAVASAQALAKTPWGTGTGALSALGESATGNLQAQQGAAGSQNPQPGTTPCVASWSGISAGPIATGTICFDGVLFLALGLVSAGTLLLGAALIAIDHGGGAATVGRKVTGSFGKIAPLAALA